MRRFVIYAWICPETGDPVYVGKTCRTVSWRMRSHYLDALKHPDQPKFQWLAKMTERGFTVEGCELERCTTELSAERERYWIGKLSEQRALLNVATGGGGGFGPQSIVWTPEVIARLGVDYDTDIAKDLGCTYQTVAYKRMCLDIPPNRTRKPNPKTAYIHDGVYPQLGKKPDRKLAADFGMKTCTVVRLRMLAKTPACGNIGPHWRKLRAIARNSNGEGVPAAA